MPIGNVKFTKILFLNMAQSRLNRVSLRLELTREGLLVKLTNHYNIRGALNYR